jgi:Ran GTPase-activating protein (RanGAP) involved in mRNA processing and transport
MGSGVGCVSKSINAASFDDVANFLSELSDDGRQRLLSAMDSYAVDADRAAYDTGKAPSVSLHVMRMDGSFVTSMRSDNFSTVGAAVDSLPESGDASGSWKRLVYGERVLKREESFDQFQFEEGASLTLVQTIPHFELDLHGNPLAALGLAAMAGSLRQDLPVSTLHLGHCHNTDSIIDLSVLASLCRKMPALQHMDLTGNRVLATDNADAGLDDFLASTTVKAFNLCRCRLRGTAAILKLCSRMTGLKEIALSSNPGFGKADPPSLIEESIPGMALMKLDLGDCGLSGACGGRFIASIVKKATGLVRLSLARNDDLGVEGIKEFAAGMSDTLGLESLSLASCGLQGADGGTAVRSILLQLPLLKELSLCSNPSFGASGLLRALDIELKQRPALSTLALSKVGLDGPTGGHAVVMCLNSISSLRSLNLSSNNFGKDGVLALAKNFPEDCGLELLSLTCCDASLEWDADCGTAVATIASKLKTLSLSGNSCFGTAGISALASRLPESWPMQVLNLTGCMQAFDEDGCWRVLQSIGEKATKLGHLDLSCWPLLELCTDRNDVVCVARTLQSLTLRDCGLKDKAGGELVAKIVNPLRALMSLDLGKNELLKAEGLKSFVRSISATSCLKTVVLDHCGLVGIDGGYALAEVFQRAPVLEDLSLRGNRDFGDLGLQSLAQSLSKDCCCSLKHLDLSDCGIADAKGADAIVSVACHCTSLEKLAISNNAIGNAGLRSLVEKLPDRIPLKALNLGYCQIEGAEGGKSVGDLVSRLC